MKQKQTHSKLLNKQTHKVTFLKAQSFYFILLSEILLKNIFSIHPFKRTVPIFAENLAYPQNKLKLMIHRCKCCVHEP